MAVKVLMFGWEFPPHNSGGLGVACQGLSRALSKNGFDITFVLPRTLELGADYMNFRFAGLEKINFRTVNSPLSPYLTSSKYKNLFGNSNGLYGPDLISEVKRYALLGAKIASEENYDVIYAHDWLSFGAGIEARQVSGKPLVVHVHATEYDRCGGEAGINSEVYEIEKAGMEEADCVIAVSEFTKETIVRHYGISPQKVIAVHNGIDDFTFPYSKSESTLLKPFKDSGYKIVTYYGRITLQKGVDYLIRAAQIVLQHRPKTLFLIIGSGDMQKQLMQEAAYYQIGDKVLFQNFLRGQELADTVSASDVVVMPSVSEPFGLVPLEAMKLGVPVIVSKQSGVSEIVKNALKVDFWDIDEMANKILAVIENPVLHKTLSQNGMEEIVEISWDKTALKIKEIIHGILKLFK